MTTTPMVAGDRFLTQPQRDLLARTLVAQQLTRDEFAMFVGQCERTRLDPFSRQIYCFKNKGRVSISATIDGFRAIAQRSGEYAGQVGPEWCGPDGAWRDVWLEETPPAAARVGVLRYGFERPVYGVATLRSYKQGSPNWSKMPDVMLAKCAEALALRKAFPHELSGIYEGSEMGREEPPPAAAEPQAVPADAEVVDAPAEPRTDQEEAAAALRDALADTTELPPHGSEADHQTMLEELVRQVCVVLQMEEDTNPWDRRLLSVWKDLFGFGRWKSTDKGVGVQDVEPHALRTTIARGDDGYSRAERAAQMVAVGTRRPEEIHPNDWPTPEAWAEFSEVS